jgi:serine/threonine-protein kinase
MEFVDGRSLDQLMPAHQPLPEVQALSLLAQLMAALTCAHHHGVWHRDVKPANLLVTRDGQLKLTDFGIARIANQGITQVASTIGTSGYMAPEQYIGEGITHRVDLFAAGVLLYRMLTGMPPFAGTPETVMFKVLHEDPLPPSVASAGRCAGAYDAIVARALAKSPQARYASAAEFGEALATRATTALRTDDDATVLVPAARMPSVPPTLVGGLGAEVTAAIEHELITLIGPIGRTLVRQAAAGCPDAGSLRAALAQHIADAKERERFLAAARIAITPAVSTPPRRAVQTDATLTSQVGEAAVSAVTAIVGPIGKLFVKRAAERATTRAQFVQLVAESIDEDDRAGVVSALQKL